ncbi:ribosomal protein S18-alanine N-acetyltransferase [Psychrobacter sp. APC 3426]|uniref:ribosomal protein S18-alanine N-acetyltransferase n=1 Tax=Psychrobacter sp. APC 3426 TaxID=3035177 RepID=UPI0025B30A5C|nr:ribosomal protein S18-alanine N-acetyltransferase [Psychrobacter sp. APC 3426]MDN3399224.1 ribosomal protein S18-alanine N-acetyltransferase [Psychrobacter sp. APC 3426]
MFNIGSIEELPINAIELEYALQEIAAIESMVQPHDAWTYQTLVELLKQDSISMLVVYEENNKKGVADNNVIGYCLYQVVFEQAEILRIGTHPDCQRQGIASQLFVRLNQELTSNQVESLMLEVRADNIPAIALYEQQGFAVIHQRKGYYQSPHQPAVDALIMQRVYGQ